MVIELKNDGEIRGVIEEVDAKMKIVLRTGLDASNFEYVEGRAIRYVHIPPAINAAAHLESYVRRLDRINAGNRPSVIKDKKKRLASSSMEEIMEPPSKR